MIRMVRRIAVIPGDGIGPEIVAEACKVLDAAAAKYGFELEYTKLLMGGASIDANGVPLTYETIVPVSYTHLRAHETTLHLV